MIRSASWGIALHHKKLNHNQKYNPNHLNKKTKEKQINKRYKK